MSRTRLVATKRAARIVAAAALSLVIPVFAPAIVILSSIRPAHAANVVVHGTVLSIAASAKTFRIRVQETGKERTVFTSATTVFRFSNGKAAGFADVKVGKTVEVKGTEKGQDGYVASSVTIRL